MSLKPNTKYKNIYLLTLVGLFNLLDGIGPHYLENNGQIRLPFSYVAVSFSPEHYLMCSRFCLVWTLLI